MGVSFLLTNSSKKLLPFSSYIFLWKWENSYDPLENKINWSGRSCKLSFVKLVEESSFSLKLYG